MTVVSWRDSATARFAYYATNHMARMTMNQLRRACLLFGLAITSPAMAAAGFQGDWAYHQTCGWRHAAGVSLKVRDGKVTGNWSDGSARGIGEQGSLQGDIRDGKLYVHFCTDSPEQMASDVGCTNFDTTQTDYFVLRGDQLDWYRQSDDNAKYLTLHRKIAGKKTPTDNHCEGEQ